MSDELMRMIRVVSEHRRELDMIKSRVIETEKTFHISRKRAFVEQAAIQHMRLSRDNTIEGRDTSVQQACLLWDAIEKEFTDE